MNLDNNRLDRLVGALLLDRSMKENFLADRLGAIERYNQGYARRFAQKPVELDEGERQLVSSLPANSVNEFVSLLAMALEGQHANGAGTELDLFVLQNELPAA